MSAIRKQSSHSALLFKTISNILDSETGVKLGEKQEAMISSRLTRRLLDLGLKEDSEYLEYLTNHKAEESKVLVSLLTTHHTFFFREFNQFEFIEREALAKIVKNARSRGEKKIRVWSAACSRGQEAYSLSMFLQHHLHTIAPDFSYEIFGTDVCAESVQIARNGVYLWSDVKAIPSVYLAGNWARGTGEISHFVRAKKEIKDACRFELGNLVTLEKEPVTQRYDLIFCRNVFIYFSHQQIETSVRALLGRLAPGGYLMVGSTETLRAYEKLPIDMVGPSVYQLKTVNTQKHLQVTQTSGATPLSRNQPLAISQVAPITQAARTIRVMCVDDSPVVLTLLKKILSTDASFEVVATAINGRDAAEKLKNIQVDVMTIDIHMPEMGGVEYLEKHLNQSHPPVVVISSVSREDAGLAVRALALGASDYVEKPELASLQNRSDEIRTKIWHASKSKPTPNRVDQATLSLASAKGFSAEKTADSLVLMFATLSDRKKLDALTREMRVQQPFPATVILVEGSETILEAVAPQIGAQIWRPGSGTLEPSKIYLADFKSTFSAIRSQKSWSRVCGLLLTPNSPASLREIASWKILKLIVDEKLNERELKCTELTPLIQDRVPATSFSYLALRHSMGD